MNRKSVLLCAAVAALLLVAEHSARAADRAIEQVREHLAAGEFEAAEAIARQIEAVAERDVALAEVAAAQDKAGNRAAAFAVLAQMNNDGAFNGALGGMTRTGGAVGGLQGGMAGGSQADFDALIELIRSTVGPPTIWDDMGGQGTLSGFEGGVHVDAHGMLRPAMKDDHTSALAAVLRRAKSPVSNSDVRTASALRKVSLNRLERAVQLQVAMGQPPTEDMQALAGLKRIQYVLVYPEERDVVLAGPAGDWEIDGEGRLVAADTKRPVVRLDDLVVVLRHMLRGDRAAFGCSITPRQESLAQVRAFVEETGKQRLRPGQRGAWLAALRDRLGPQDIEFNGIDPTTRVARVLVEADYRMKLVGMGLEEGGPDVPSYLEMVNVPAGGKPPPMDVLRWWFTVNYDAVLGSAERDAFELRGQGVKVLSENELLTATGQRVHTGESSGLNERFAANFTRHFSALCEKYPIYTELQNIFDLALVGALMREEQLAEKAQWQMLYFGKRDGYPVRRWPAPQTVETVINHRVIGGVHIVVGVSGGVRVDPNALVASSAMKTDEGGDLRAERRESMPGENQSRAAWWWD